MLLARVQSELGLFATTVDFHSNNPFHGMVCLERRIGGYITSAGKGGVKPPFHQNLVNLSSKNFPSLFESGKVEDYIMAARSLNDNEFDFECNYIAKSPCRDCNLKRNLPGCSNTCLTLSQVQALLSRIRSRSNKFLDYEEYSLLR